MVIDGQGRADIISEADGRVLFPGQAGISINTRHQTPDARRQVTQGNKKQKHKKTWEPRPLPLRWQT